MDREMLILVAQREMISYFGELDMRNKIFEENRVTDCQEIEELRRICCEETDRARQWKIDEISMQQDRNPSTMSQLLTQIQDLQNKVNSLNDAREFNNLETASSSGTSHFPQPTLEYSESQRKCLAAILDCRTIHGIQRVPQETFLKFHLLEKDHPQLSSRTQRIWHHLLAD